MLKLSVLFFLFFFIISTSIAQTPFTLDSVMTYLNDARWQEMTCDTEWSKPTDSTVTFADSSWLNVQEDRTYPMLMFSDIYKVDDGLWKTFCYPFNIRDKVEGTINIPTYAPLRGNAQLVNEKITISYSQGDITDEILFFDKKTLVIRHITPEKIEYIRYKRSD
jgi:hypothetical protein